MSSEDQEFSGAEPPDEPTGQPLPEGSADALDEDLFDFPALGKPLGSSVTAREEEAAPSDIARPLEELLEVPLEGVLEEPLRSEQATADSPPAAAGLDLDLDEDIFGFPIIPGLSQDNPVPDIGDSAFDSPGDLLLGSVDEDLLALIESSADELEASQRTARAAREDEIPTPITRKSAPAPASRPSEKSSEPAPPGAADLSPEALAALVTLVPGGSHDASTRRSVLPRNRLLWMLVGPSVVANLVLVIFAWKASAAFDSNVTELRNELFDTVKNVRRDSLNNRRPLIGITAPLEDGPESGSATSIETAQPRDGLQSGEELQLRIALEELESDRFGDARLRLFRLLSLIDGMTGPRRDEVETQASFLIARTYRLQARDMREAGR